VSLRRCWGIFREGAHSPGRETDDTEILRLTGKMLEGRGFEVTVKNPEEIADSGDPHPRALFVMCERLPILRALRDWEAVGARVVNAPLAILDTYRERTLRLWEAARVPFPPSRVVSTRRPRVSDLRPSAVQYPLWVKRADVHYVEEGDVTRVWTPEDAAKALGGLARRRISRGVLQTHIGGDLLKFYGIGGRPRSVERGSPPRWFRYFHHRGQEVRGYPFDPESLRDLAGRAAAVLGLEVFGGDAIVTPSGDIVLIDLNAWPSFALFREEAAAEIAAYLEERFTRD
jgi:glutathione synthase/RimK-type ligase-like ATP-grasp enzyme